jgi:hypothetical protein
MAARMDAAHDTWLQWLSTAEMAVCEHEWEDAGSYAGPDTGYDSHQCRKCGLTFEHTYY